MWTIPFFISIALVLVLWALQRGDQNRTKRAGHRYYHRHRALLEDLDRIRRGLIAVFSKVSEDGVNENFTSYERLVTDFERLLVSFRLLPLTSPNLGLLKSAELLVDGLQVRLAAIDRALEQNPSQTKSRKPGAQLAGCYFCSKPAVAEPLRRVRIKIDTDFKQVLGCSACREAVRVNRTAKVLFFVKDGKSLHWSESPDYRPDESYFQINVPNAKELGRSQLRLVYSTVDERAETNE